MPKVPTRSKRLLKSIVPPFLWDIGKDIKRRLLPSVDHFAYAPEGWATRLPEGTTSEDYWNRFIARERSACEALIARLHERDSRLPLTGDLKDVLFGYVLALAARHKQKISVLDYGGNLGDHYWFGKAFVPGVELDYHCKELPMVVEAGRQMTPAISWHTDDMCLTGRYDLVMFSSSLQYLPEWRDVLRRATESALGYLWLSDVPSVRDVPAFVVTERSGGAWNLQLQLNRAEIVDTVERGGLRLMHEFDMGPHPRVANAPEQPACLGWLFQRDPHS